MHYGGDPPHRFPLSADGGEGANAARVLKIPYLGWVLNLD